MKNWIVELITKGKSCVEVKIQRRIFQGDALSSLLFVIAMILRYYIHSKFTGDNKFTKSQEKIYHFVYLDDIKQFTKNEKEFETDINNKNIQSVYMNGICHGKMCDTHNEKWRKTNNRRNRPAKSIKNQNAWKKEKIQALGNIDCEHHQTSGDKRKKEKRVLQTSEKTSGNPSLQQKSH